MTIQNEFAERLQTFLDVFTEEETDTFARSLAAVGEMVEAGFGEDRAAQVMAAISRIIDSPHLASAVDLSPLDDWREYFADIDVSARGFFPPNLLQAQDVASFANFGILASWEHIVDGVPQEGLEKSIEDVPAYIEGAISNLEEFMQLFGERATTWAFESVQRTILAARGRLKIDLGQPLTVHELAAASGVATKRIQNAIYAKSDDAPIPDTDGLISVASAERWLTARQYQPSIWREYLGERKNGVQADTANNEDDDRGTDEYLFVPEAADGSVFAPSCARGGGENEHYLIGAKGNQQPFDDYDDALKALTAMNSPKWNRKNPNGNFGIVKAARWRRISRSELAHL